MCDRVEAELIAFGVSLAVGAFFAVFPGTAARFDERLRSWFENEQGHAAFLRGLGYLLLCFSAASLLAALVDLLSPC